MLRLFARQFSGSTATLAAGFLCVLSETAIAHPGHGTASSQQGLWHYLTSPLHVAPLIVLSILVAAGLWVANAIVDEESDL